MSTIIGERFGLYGRRVLLVLLAAVPVVMLPNTLDIFNLAKLTVIWALGLAAFWLWFAWARQRGERAPRFNLAYATAAFLGALSLATLFSQNRVVSLMGIYERFGGLIPTLLYAGVMLLMVALFWEEPADLKTVPVAVAGGSIVVSGYALIQAAGLDWIAWSTRGGGPPEFPGSTLGNSNFVGGYLAMTFPFILYLIVSTQKASLRYLAGFAMVAAGAALWFSGSRGGMIAAGGGLLCMALVFRDRLGKAAKRSLVAVCISAVALAVTILWHPGMSEPPAPLREWDVFRTDTFRLRSFYWTAAWRIFLDNPLVGTGPDTYKENYETYRLALNARDLATGTPDKPHNIYLEYAANSGLLGLGTFLTLAALAFRYGFRQTRSLEGGDKALLAMFLGAFTAYLLQGVFSMDLPSLAVFGWAAIGGIAVLADPRLVKARGDRLAVRAKKQKKHRSGDNAGAAERNSHGRHPGRAQVAVGVALAALMAFGFRPIRADVTAKSALGGTSDLLGDLANLEKAVKLYPWGFSYETMPATRVFRQARLSPEGAGESVFRRGHLWLSRGARREPENKFFASNLARLNGLWAARQAPSRYAVADQWWQKTVGLDPSAWRPKLSYGSFLGEWALKTHDPAVKRRTVSVLESVMRLKPERPEVWLALGKSYILTGQIPQARIAVRQALEIRPEYASARIWLRRIDASRRTPNT